MRASSVTPVFLLGLFSIFPFFIFTLASLTGKHLFGYSGIELFASYGALTLSFANGMISGQILENKVQKYSRRTMFLNHILMLVAWATLFMKVPELSICVLVLGFITTFWLDGRWLRLVSNSYKKYSKIRFSLTTILCALHIVVLFPVY